MPSPNKKSKKSQKFEAVSDGHGGVILPDEAVNALQTANRITPVDKNFRQTPDMLIFEGCAGRVTEVSKGEYTALAMSVTMTFRHTSPSIWSTRTQQSPKTMRALHAAPPNLTRSRATGGCLNPPTRTSLTLLRTRWARTDFMLFRSPP